jgi:hypothetical protein
VTATDADGQALTVSMPVALTRAQVARLRALARQIELPADGRDPVEALLSGLASAALAEYLAHATLQPPLTTVGALRELRLAVLSEHLLGGDLPGEGFVADLFALTGSEARTLLRRSVARQPERLQQAIRAAALRAVQAAKPADSKNESYVLTAEPAVVSMLYELLEHSRKNPPRFEPRTDAIGKYDMPATTREVLLNALAEAAEPASPGDRPAQPADSQPARGRRARDRGARRQK